MEFRCQLCNSTDVGRIELTDNGIEIACTSCHGASFVAADRTLAAPSTGRRRAPRPSNVDAHCPKCDSAVAISADACRECGLRRDLFDEFAADAERDAPAELQTQWDALSENWDDTAAHDRFVQAASAANAYGFAARLYRRADRERGGDSTATSRLARITRMAEVALLAKPLEVEDIAGVKSYKGVLALMVFILVLAVGGGIYMLAKKSGDPPTGVNPTRTTDDRPSRPRAPAARDRGK